MRNIAFTAIGCFLWHFVCTQTNVHDTWMDPLSVCTNEKLSLDEFYSLNTSPPEDFESCIKPFEDISIIWLKFIAESNSSLAFQLVPLNPDDDLDFALFESNNGVPKKLVRCVATGVLLDRDRNIQGNCKGPTGLAKQESDAIELPGCSELQNNFVSDIQIPSTQEYLLLITNYSSTRGFTLEWPGGASISNDLCKELKDQSEILNILIHPNPLSRVLTYTISSTLNRDIDLFLVSSNGNILRTEKLSLLPGDNRNSMQLSNYLPGTYYLYVSGENGISEYSKFELLK